MSTSGMPPNFKRYSVTANIDNGFKLLRWNDNWNAGYGSGYHINNWNTVWSLPYTGDNGPYSDLLIKSNFVNGRTMSIVTRTDNSNETEKFGFMMTSGTPRTISSVSGGTGTVAASTAVSIDIVLSAAKHSEEFVLVRYTRDGFANSSFVTATLVSGSTYRATIPASANASTGTVTWYAMTSTVETPSTDTDYLTLTILNNSGSNYSYTVANVPTVTTPTAASITTTSATLGGNVTGNGGAALTSRGTVWGTSAAPTVNSLNEGGATTGVFTHSRTGLTANTLYTYRAYAVNGAGTGYSADANFTTLPLPPTVGTGSSATTSGFTANWSHPTMGAVAYTYTVEVDNNSAFGSIDATVSSISSANTSQAITGLNAGTTYYYRVRAVNATGASANSSTSAGIATSAASAVISSSGTPAALSTTYGTASSSTSFSVSGTSMAAGILVTPPSGFEVSTNNSTFSSTVTVGAAGTISSTLVYVRLAATASAGSKSGNIVLSSSGATSVNVATTASTVNQKAITISGASATNRAYDGTTTVAVTGGSLSTGSGAGQVLSGDTVTLSAASATGSVTSAAVGNTKAVTVTGYSISGASSGNYSITQPTGLTVNITQKAVTITGLTYQNKVYDRTTTASVTGTAALSGVISGDSANVSLGGTPAHSFASATVGSAKAVTTTGYSISGTASGNYSLTQPSGTANITAATLTVTGATATDRVYNALTTVTVSGGSLSGVISGDTVTLGGSPAGTVATATVGSGKVVTVTGYSISGTDSTNYSLTQPSLTVNITKATPTITTAPTASALFKGAELGFSTLSGGAATGVGGASLTGGTFSWTDAGTTTVTATGSRSVTYTPQDTTNYNNATTNVTLTVNPVPNPTTVSAASGGQTSINLTTTRNSSINVLIVRKQGSAVDFTPVDGTLYTDGQDVGGGNIVVRRSMAADSLNDNGLSHSTTYHYRVFSEYFRHYSSGLTANATTDTPPPNYGFRDDGGVNLPTLTYSVNGTSSTDRGSVFNNKNLSSGVTSLSLTGANIKTWKSSGGDVTGAKIGYKIWKQGESEPATYTERELGFTSNDNAGNTDQTWASFGSAINLLTPLGSNYGTYNFKVLFYVNGTGTPAGSWAATNGPWAATFTYPQPATITTSGSLAAMTTTYGTASSSSSVSVTGSSLTANITVAAVTGLEFSTDGSTWASTASFTPSSGSVSGTLYVRLAATAAAGNYNSTAITLSSTGASNATVNTASTGNAVAKKALTVTAGNQSIVYGTTNTVVTGAGSVSYSGFANGDTSSVVGGTISYTTTYTATTAAGTAGVTITPVTTSLTAANYSFSPANGTITVTALNDPGTLSAAKGSTHPMTRVSLSWSKADNRDVLIVRNTSDSWTAPSTGTEYTAGNSLGAGTVVYKGSGTSMDNDLLLPGTTYYYRFYSENYGTYSAGATASATTDMPQSRNATTPVSPSTLYVGDAATFSLDSTATITSSTNTSWGQPRIYIKQGDGDLASGLRTDGDFTNVTVKSVASTNRFTNSGTWYWGIQMSYGADYGSAFWHKATSVSYANMATDGNGSTLTLSVSVLPNPASLAVSGTNTNSITLSYARQGRSGAEFAAVVVRKAGSAVDWTPTPGQTYSNGFSTNGNTIVAWQNFTTGITDSGLSNNTTYYYKVYSENYGYYSAGAETNATTLGPSISTSGSFSAISATYGTPSASATTVTVTGAYLTADITATAPAGFEVSSNGTTWGSTATFTPSSGSVNGTLRVRLPGAASVASSPFSGSVQLSSAGASSVNVDVPSSTVTAATIASDNISLIRSGDTYAASSSGVSGFTLSYAGRTANSITNNTSYGANAPTGAGYYTVTATSSDSNYSGSKSEDYFITGPVAGDETVSRPTATMNIPRATLLQNDKRIDANGDLQTNNLSITAVAAGTGSPTVGLSHVAFVSFSPGGNGTETFAYTLTDSVTSKTATGTVTVVPLVWDNAFGFTRMDATPSYDGFYTEATVTFTGTPNVTYQIRYKGEMNQAWRSAGGWYSESGTFQVLIQEEGDHVSDWSQSMFFEATR
jgi:hypothetical protein